MEVKNSSKTLNYRAIFGSFIENFVYMLMVMSQVISKDNLYFSLFPFIILFFSFFMVSYQIKRSNELQIIQLIKSTAFWFVFIVYIVTFVVFYFLRELFSIKLEMINLYLNKLLPAILFFKGIYYFSSLIWSEKKDESRIGS